jgi:hypothetical protein
VEKVVQALGITSGQGPSSSSSSSLPLEYPELARHNILAKLKSWIYKCCRVSANGGHDDVTALVKDIQNATDHWAGDHITCIEIDSSRNCVQHPNVEKRRFDFNNKTHIAMKQWSMKHITGKKLSFTLEHEKII